jgi:hypothetical protein
VQKPSAHIRRQLMHRLLMHAKVGSSHRMQNSLPAARASKPKATTAAAAAAAAAGTPTASADPDPGPVLPTKQVVHIQHGLLGSSTDFVLNGPDNSLPMILADAGGHKRTLSCVHRHEHH